MAIRSDATEYIIWTFGRGTITVDTSPYCTRPIPRDLEVEVNCPNDRAIILHPILENVFFLAFARYPGLVIFYEFTKGVLTGTYGSTSAKFDRSYLVTGRPHHAFPPVAEENMTLMLKADLDDTHCAHLYGDLCYYRELSAENFKTYHFNILTKALSVSRYRIPSPRSYRSANAWGGQWIKQHEFYPIINKPKKSADGHVVDGPILACYSSADCPSVTDDASPPVYARDPARSSGATVRRRLAMTKLDEEKLKTFLLSPESDSISYNPEKPKYCLEARDYPQPPPDEFDYKEPVLWQDEEFIVVKVNCHITVWSFFTDLVTGKGELKEESP